MISEQAALSAWKAIMFALAVVLVLALAAPRKSETVRGREWWLP